MERRRGTREGNCNHGFSLKAILKHFHITWMNECCNQGQEGGGTEEGRRGTREGGCNHGFSFK